MILQSLLDHIQDLINNLPEPVRGALRDLLLYAMQRAWQHWLWPALKRWWTKHQQAKRPLRRQT